MPTNAGNYVDPQRARMHQATLALNNEQIKTLGDGVAIDVVAAPGANRVIRLVDAIGRLDTVGGAYGGLDTGSGWGFFTDSVSGFYVTSIVPLSGVIDTPETSLLIWSIFSSRSADMVGTGDYDGLLVSNMAVTVPQTTAVDKPLQFADWWAGGAYSGGHTDNTLRLSVGYLIWDLTAGVYV